MTDLLTNPFTTHIATGVVLLLVGHYLGYRLGLRDARERTIKLIPTLMNEQRELLAEEFEDKYTVAIEVLTDEIRLLGGDPDLDLGLEEDEDEDEDDGGEAVA